MHIIYTYIDVHIYTNNTPLETKKKKTHLYIISQRRNFNENYQRFIADNENITTETPRGKFTALNTHVLEGRKKS